MRCIQFTGALTLFLFEHTSKLKDYVTYTTKLRYVVTRGHLPGYEAIAREIYI